MVLRFFADRPTANPQVTPVQPNSINLHRAEGAYSPQGNTLPSWFPTQEWSERQRIYAYYWRWYTGEALSEMSGGGKTKAVPKYPLAINLIPNIVEKRASVMAGETLDNSKPLVSPLIKPRPSKKTPTEEEKKLCKELQTDITEIWMDNNARTIQYENMQLSQVLGGCVFQVVWDADGMEDSRIPIRIKAITPDHFLPVYKYDDPWDLLEAIVSYRITPAEARLRYSVIADGAYPIYIERWTKDTFEIWVNDKKITDLSGANEFGFVPFVYIPNGRAGSFWGQSIVPMVENLIREYNSRLADIGDAIRRNTNPRRYARNIEGIVKKPLDGETSYFDIGKTPMYNEKLTPEIIREDPINLSDSLVNHPDALRDEILRLTSLSKIVYGEDEGSQRSALTLAFRMFPLTSAVNVMRSYWDVGLAHIIKMIIKILIKKQPLLNLGYTIPPDILKEITIGQVWNPMIPRDREAIINEIVLLYPIGAMSLYEALEKRGDVRDIEETIKKIEADAKRKAENNAMPSKEQKPSIDISRPVASTDLED